MISKIYHFHNLPHISPIFEKGCTTVSKHGDVIEMHKLKVASPKFFSKTRSSGVRPSRGYCSESLLLYMCIESLLLYMCIESLSQTGRTKIAGNLGLFGAKK